MRRCSLKEVQGNRGTWVRRYVHGSWGLDSYLLHSLSAASVAHCCWTTLAIAFHHIHNIASGRLHISGFSEM